MAVKSADELRDLVRRIFLIAGSDQVNADCVADHLVSSNLSGVDTHGVWHIPIYIDEIKKGNIIATAHPAIVKETPATALVRGNWAFGHLSARYAMEVAIEKGTRQGLAMVSLVASNHIGRLGHYVDMAARAGLMSMIWGAGIGLRNPRTVPFGGRKPVLDTNPIAMGAPAGDNNPVMFDYASTALSGVKVVNAQRRGQQLPPNCIVDKQGRPTTDPNDFFDGGAFLPFGGHKGYALMAMTEVFGGLLAASESYADEGQGTPMFRPQGVLMQVFKADLFQPMAEYRQRVDNLTERLRSTPPAEGFDRVMAPGDPEARARIERGHDGIPIANDVWQSIVEAAATLGITDI